MISLNLIFAAEFLEICLFNSLHSIRKQEKKGHPFRISESVSSWDGGSC